MHCIVALSKVKEAFLFFRDVCHSLAEGHVSSCIEVECCVVVFAALDVPSQAIVNHQSEVAAKGCHL